MVVKTPFCIKICKKCGRLLVANTINFHKSKGKKYNLKNDCKNCCSNHNKQYRQDNLEEIREKDRERSKIKRQSEEGKLYIEKYRAENKEKIVSQRKEYYESHKEERKEYIRNNKDKKKIWDKKYAETHKKQISDYKKQWCEDNPEKIFNYNNNRRLKEESQGSGISKDQWYEMMEFFEWKCAYSGEYLGGNSLQRSIDHIVPLDKGGINEAWNCVPMIKNYNSGKCNKEMLDWYTQQPFFNKDRLGKIYEWIEYAKDKYKK